jgi:hypothetical protein
MKRLLNEGRRAGKHEAAAPRLQSLLERHRRANSEACEVADAGYVDHPVNGVGLERGDLRVNRTGACPIEATVERYDREPGLE